MMMNMIIFWTAVLMLALVMSMFVYVGFIAVAHGQQIDPRYKCIENPFLRSCDPQLQKDKQEIMGIINKTCDMDRTLCLFK